MSVISDAGGERPIGLGGVMGGASTGCSDTTTRRLRRKRLFRPDHHRPDRARHSHQLRRRLPLRPRRRSRLRPSRPRPRHPTDPRAVRRRGVGRHHGQPDIPAAPVPFEFDPAYVKQLAGLDVSADRTRKILRALGFTVVTADIWTVTPPTWRRDVDGKADLVEEVARIEGFGALPSAPLPVLAAKSSGILTPRPDPRPHRAPRRLRQAVTPRPSPGASPPGPRPTCSAASPTA